MVLSPPGKQALGQFLVQNGSSNSSFMLDKVLNYFVYLLMDYERAKVRCLFLTGCVCVCVTEEG